MIGLLLARLRGAAYIASGSCNLLAAGKRPGSQFARIAPGWRTSLNPWRNDLTGAVARQECGVTDTEA
jgi:hypothetical protein